MKIEGRWYPKRMIFKDILKKGKGTEFIIDDIQFDVNIPESRFSKAALRKQKRQNRELKGTETEKKYKKSKKKRSKKRINTGI